jgi:hypothetical protein
MPRVITPITTGASERSVHQERETYPANSYYCTGDPGEPDYNRQKTVPGLHRAGSRLLLSTISAIQHPGRKKRQLGIGELSLRDKPARSVREDTWHLNLTVATFTK